MSVDVSSQILVHRLRDQVAAYAMNPDNIPKWYVNIKSVEWRTPRPLRLGSQIALVAEFLGGHLAYTYEIVALVPGERLVMRTSTPFPMETSYRWESANDGSTRMTLRNRGNPTGFVGLAAPIIGMAIRRASGKDLSRLKQILEGHEDMSS